MSVHECQIYQAASVRSNRACQDSSILLDTPAVPCCAAAARTQHELAGPMLARIASWAYSGPYAVANVGLLVRPLRKGPQDKGCQSRNQCRSAHAEQLHSQCFSKAALRL